MHHAYPRECGFPSTSDDAIPLTPAEYANVTGHEAVDASQEQMLLHAASANETFALEDLPWTMEEDILENTQHLDANVRQGSWFQCLAALAVLASFAVPLLRAHHVALERKSEV